MVSPSSSSQSSNKESIFLNSFYNNEKYEIILWIIKNKHAVAEIKKQKIQIIMFNNRFVRKIFGMPWNEETSIISKILNFIDSIFFIS